MTTHKTLKLSCVLKDGPQEGVSLMASQALDLKRRLQADRMKDSLLKSELTLVERSGKGAHGRLPQERVKTHHLSVLQGRVEKFPTWRF